MTKDQLKELVKEHFNLVENSQEFDSATLEDGSKVTNDMDEKFEVGQKLYIIDEEGNKVDAPEGDHISESGIVLTVDAEGVIVGMKEPDEAGEGSDAEQLEEEAIEEKMSEEVEETTEEFSEESTKEGVNEEMAEQEDEAEMEAMPALEDIISVIGEVVEEKMGAIKEKMEEIKEEVDMMKEKMSSFASESAEERTVPTAKFSSVKTNRNDKRYNAMLQKLNNK